MNDFKDLKTQNNQQQVTSGTKVQESRAVAEIQAAVLMAKQCPRNESQSYLDIVNACKRPSMADQALYAYPRGGSLVEGPSIRLAEVLARYWGNCRVGITIQSQTPEKTEARAYAYDMQSNYMVDQDFTVPHKRTTKKGTKILTDERDIRELVANIGSRYLRGCILRLVPGDVLDDAIAQCKTTMTTSEIPMADRVKKMVTLFNEQGVSVEQLEKRLGHNLDAIIPQELVTLQGIYKSLKDGMAKREDFFDFGVKDDAGAKESVSELLGNKKESKKQ